MAVPLKQDTPTRRSKSKRKSLLPPPLLALHNKRRDSESLLEVGSTPDGPQLRTNPTKRRKHKTRSFRFALSRKNSSDPEPANSYTIEKNNLFGVPLELLSSNQPQTSENSVRFEGDNYLSDIPYFVRCVVEQLYAKGVTKTEGVFRKCGVHQELVKSRTALDESYPENMDSILDPLDIHTTADLLKLFLRELPSALIPPLLFEHLLQAFQWIQQSIDIRTSSGSKSKLWERSLLYTRATLWRIPSQNRNLFFFLLELLVEISNNSSNTLMGMKGLSTVFAPIFFGPNDAMDHFDFIKQNELRCNLLEFLMENFSKITEETLPLEALKVTSSYQNENASLLKGEQIFVFFQDSKKFMCSIQQHSAQFPTHALCCLKTDPSYFTTNQSGPASGAGSQTERRMWSVSNPDSRFIPLKSSEPSPCIVQVTM